MSAKNIARRLLKFNEFLYNFPCHLIILTAWVSVFFIPAAESVQWWFKTGLVIWVILFLYRFIQDKGKITKGTGGLLSWLVGLNIIVVLSLLCFPLLIFLARALRNSRD